MSMCMTHFSAQYVCDVADRHTGSVVVWRLIISWIGFLLPVVYILHAGGDDIRVLAGGFLCPILSVGQILTLWLYVYTVLYMVMV